MEILKMDPNYEFDYIAENIFSPIYPVIADDIIDKTEIYEGDFLDIGCGGGHLGFSLMKKTDFKGTFIDINEFAVEKAKKRAKSLGLDSKAEILIEDVCDMSFDDNTFDLIISRGSMGFWDDHEKAFSEIYRILKPRGKTYIGGGLGSRELYKDIYEKMQAVDPGWPNARKNSKRKKKKPTEYYMEIFRKLDFHKYSEVKNEEKGRWFIIEKA